MNLKPQPEGATAAADPFVFEAGEANFEADVLQASLETPVLVDFWATWCGPCKTLGPTLEKLAGEYAGAFRLAKIDCDKEQQLAGMFGVRSIPTVVLIQGGQIVDAFSGALPESQVREFLKRHRIEPATRIEAPAQEVEDDNAPAETPKAAIARIEKALAAAPDDAALKLDLALAKARTGDTANAQATLDALPVDLAEDDRAKALAALLAMQGSLAGIPGAAELLARVERDPRDFAAHDGLGVRQLLGGDAADAMQHWLAILAAERGWNDGLARKRLLDAFRIVNDESLVAATRRQMSSLLF
ncbi:MAG: thioredoxin [Xanthomonadales bacterium]|nr:thioredoxin [Xanthomonadales bacterium]ODU92933.1 MAG: thioredoxin [Rhodanobacter sp. SCN 66-43]OJY83723.1 MAG: thioredoxin [Xanthomonadales bacterium 66-474]